MSEANTSRTSRDSLRISSVEAAGWESPPAGYIPSAGDTVYCTDGPAEVMRVLGRTSDGSRLLELRCSSRPQPFFAAVSNVLIRLESEDADAAAFLDESDVGGVL